MTHKNGNAPTETDEHSGSSQDPGRASAMQRVRPIPSPTLKAARLSQVLDAASALFRRHGYYETTMQDIASQAGISVGLIYQYARNKEEVLLLVIEDIINDHARALPAAMAGLSDPVERLAAGFAAYCRVVDARRDAVLLAYRETKTLSRSGRDRLKALEMETNRLLADEVRGAIVAGQMVDADPQLVAHNLTVLAQAWALKHWALAPNQTLERYIAFQTMMILRCLLVPERHPEYPHLAEPPIAEALASR